MKRLRIALKYSLVALVLIFLLSINRDKLLYKIGRILPRDEAMLLKGMVWGEEINDREWKRKMIDSGLIHLVVVSGGNLMILMWGEVDLLSGWINRKAALILALVLGWWYVNFTGWQISSLRAILLVSLMVVAQLVGRRFCWWRSTIVVVLIMLLVDIGMIYDSSFWLSFGAFLGSVTGRFWWKNIWVVLWIVPILWWNFKIVNLVILFSSFLVLIVAEIVVMGGILALILGNLGYWLLLPVLKYFLVVIEILSKVEWMVTVKMNMCILAGWYLILIGLSRRMDYEN